MAQSYLYLGSSDIKIYPSAQRSDIYDRNAKLTTEQNLISLINRLTGQDSFVISGLDITSDGRTLKAGSCNIHGYLFNILNDIDISSQQLNASPNSYLYLVIRLKVNEVTYKNLTNSEVKTKYEELSAIDLNYIENGQLSNNLNFDGADGNKFTGLMLYVGDENYKPNDNTYILPLAKYTNNRWQTIISNDSSNKQNRWNTQKFNAKDILVEAEKVNTDNYSTGIYYEEKQDLLTWLQYNFVIDDGEIK